MEIAVQRIATGFTGGRCFVHARAGISPDRKEAVITIQPLRLNGSDIFYGLHILHSGDGGQTWSPISEQPELARIGYSNGCELVMCDATPQWHATSGRFLLTGHSCIYHNNEHYPPPSPSFSMYSIFDPDNCKWTKPEPLVMDRDRYFHCGAGCSQRVDLKNGDILLPVYFMSRKEAETPWNSSFHSTVICCAFDGRQMKVLATGNVLTCDTPRGFCEPSLARIGGDFYLTLRNDLKGYVSHSRDGLHFEPAREWLFDDGSELGNYNTQQHWITAGERLYLVYTRRGAGNDHVFRHRAPLFIAEVDRQTLRVIRSSEKIAVPERGARLGNFGCLHVDEQESWVVAAEWMQTNPPDPYDWKTCMRYGSDNSIFIAKIHFT